MCHFYLAKSRFRDPVNTIPALPTYVTLYGVTLADAGSVISSRLTANSFRSHLGLKDVQRFILPHYQWRSLVYLAYHGAWKSQ